MLFLFVTIIATLLVLAALGKKKHKEPIEPGDVVALKSRYFKEFANIVSQDQLNVISVNSSQAEVTFFSIKTRKIYTSTLPKDSLRKIS